MRVDATNIGVARGVVFETQVPLPVAPATQPRRDVPDVLSASQMPRDQQRRPVMISRVKLRGEFANVKVIHARDYCMFMARWRVDSTNKTNRYKRAAATASPDCSIQIPPVRIYREQFRIIVHTASSVAEQGAVLDAVQLTEGQRRATTARILMATSDYPTHRAQR